MAHSYVQAFSTEEAAFLAFAEDRPDQATLLVDTYDTMAGVEAAIEVIRRLGFGGRASIRLDSGDLGALARWSRTGECPRPGRSSGRRCRSWPSRSGSSPRRSTRSPCAR